MVNENLLATYSLLSYIHESFGDERMVLYACVMVSAVVVMNTLLPDFLVTKRIASSNLIFLGYFLSGYYVKQYLLQKPWSKPVLNTSAILLLLLSFSTNIIQLSTKVLSYILCPSVLWLIDEM